MMRIGSDGRFQLTYCTNIHPSDGWPAALANLQRYGPALRARLAPGQPFGIGLRLSGKESRELLLGDQLAQFQAFLAAQGLYVFTINGFPYGTFHRQPVKAHVHTPDWREEERVQYTLRLAKILARLLPAGMDGGISTSPLSYRSWVDVGDTAMWEHLTRQIVRVAAALAQIAARDGRLIHLDIEPEPDGLLENSVELASFFDEWLLPRGGRMLAEQLNLSLDAARELLLDHVRMCWDTCHVSLAYESPADVLARLDAVGIKVGKIQVSSALKVALPHDPAERGEAARALQPFVESIYLHQVIQRSADGTLRHYADLPEALAQIGDPQAEQWRVHFHVPIFIEHCASFSTTQDDIQRTFALLQQRPFCRQLEIETYTWEVLPPALKVDLLESIAREYEWVRDVAV